VLDIVAPTLTATCPAINLTASGTVTVSNDLSITGRVATSTVTAVSISAANEDLDASVGNIFTVTSTDGAKTLGAGGAESCSIINPTAGQKITLLFLGGDVDVLDASNVCLVGAATFTAAADDTLELVYIGTKWFETGRSVNS
jgi:hypothetical protein